MVDLPETFNGLFADSLGRAVGGDQFGMLLLEPIELLYQPVVIQIADLRRGLGIILAVVVADLLAKLLDFGSNPGTVRLHGTFPRHGCLSELRPSRVC